MSDQVSQSINSVENKTSKGELERDTLQFDVWLLGAGSYSHVRPNDSKNYGRLDT